MRSLPLHACLLRALVLAALPSGCGDDPPPPPDAGLDQREAGSEPDGHDQREAGPELDGSDQREAGLAPDGSDQREAGPEPDDTLLAALARSRAAWEQLAQQHGETYWYEEQDCSPGFGRATLVQITDGSVDSAEVSPPDSCDEGATFRYEDFVAVPFEALYDACAQLLADAAANDAGWQPAIFETDAQGVVRTCKARARACFDACDSGFHIARWGFGTPD